MGASTTITALANLMCAKTSAGKPFVVMLGAGASMSAGVVSTDRLVREIVDAHGPNIAGTDYWDRFSELWANTSEETRGIYLKPYLDRRPSPGYADLVALIQHGYIGTVITFNFDNLLETALVDAGFREGQHFKVIVRGDHKDDRVVTMMEAAEPRIKVLKLHGSLRGGGTFLFSQEEMSGYPDEIAGLLERLTVADIIVCGYGFSDNCVIRAFSTKGESIYCANPSGAPPNLKGFLYTRNSVKNIISGDEGKFDTFFGRLRAAVLKPRQARIRKAAFNPFKFLDSYEYCDKEWLYGRRALTRRLVARIDEEGAGGRRAVVPVVGRPKVGKTSFIRAGLLPYLDPVRYRPLYVRCTKDIEESLPRALRLKDAAPGADLPAALDALARSEADRQVVLVLDQFERVLPQFKKERDLSAFVSLLGKACCERLAIVLVSESDADLMLCLSELGIRCVAVKPLEPRAVGRIVRTLARKAEIEFEPAVIDTLRQQYSDSRMDAARPAFTLAHIQALCSLMIEDALSGGQDLNSALLADTQSQHLDSLNRAINQFDMLSFVEDLPLEEQRALLCRIFRIVAEPARARISEYLRDHFNELLRTRSQHSMAAGAAGGR